MKHVTAETSSATLERLRDASSRFQAGSYTCDACLDTGLLYALRAPHRRVTVGVVPCTECAKGAERHLDGNLCLWARGTRPCSLCGAREGEHVPAGWTPQPPSGWIPYDELPHRKGDV